MLLLDPVKRTVCLLVTSNAWNGGRHTTLRSRAISKGYHITNEAKISIALMQGVYQGRLVRDAAVEDRLATDDKVDPNTLLLGEIIDEAIRRGATDIKTVIRPGDPATTKVRFRVNGVVVDHRMDYTPEQLLGAMAAGFAGPTTRGRSDSFFNERVSQSCMIGYETTGKKLDLRFKSQPVAGGLNVEMRLLMSDVLSDEQWTLERAGYAPSQIRDINLALRRKGMMLVLGITGSGKSTTLKIVLEMIPDREHRAIWTIEDPAEYRIHCAYQISVDRNDGDVDGNPFLAPARSILRLDPDVVMIGEIRDAQLGEVAKNIQLTGHKFLSTLHVESVMAAFERMESVAFSRRLVSSKDFLSALIYQRLVPCLCPDCRLPAADHLPSDTLKDLEFIGSDVTRLWTTNPAGCDKCDYSGNSGQTIAAEVLLPDREFLQLIRDGQDLEAEDKWLGQCQVSLSDPDCTGKLAMEHAIYAMCQGRVDPLAVEREFEPFSSYINNYGRLRQAVWKLGRDLCGGRQ